MVSLTRALSAITESVLGCMMEIKGEGARGVFVR